MLKYCEKYDNILHAVLRITKYRRLVLEMLFKIEKFLEITDLISMHRKQLMITFNKEDLNGRKFISEN